jgi:hypothetical protein
MTRRGGQHEKHGSHLNQFNFFPLVVSSEVKKKVCFGMEAAGPPKFLIIESELLIILLDGTALLVR